MFLPDNLKDQNAEKQEKDALKAAYIRVEGWAMELIPDDARDGVHVSVQEVECFDPECSPIDTVVAIIYTRGGRGMVGIPLEAKNVTKNDLESTFPTQDVLQKWSRGIDADWPPLDDDSMEEEEEEDSMMPSLRFQVGQRVECRTGPDPVHGWIKGEIVQLWYREAGWPPNSWAPYKIQLDNGKKLFAPADQDHIIRAEQN